MKITWQELEKGELGRNTIVRFEESPEARKPSCRFWID
jgi:hypothetical protein